MLDYCKIHINALRSASMNQTYDGYGYGTRLWDGMVRFGMAIVGFIFVVWIGAMVGFVAGIGLGYVVTLPLKEDTQERVTLVFAVMGAIATVTLAVYWLYF